MNFIYRKLGIDPESTKENTPLDESKIYDQLNEMTRQIEMFQRQRSIIDKQIETLMQKQEMLSQKLINDKK